VGAKLATAARPNAIGKKPPKKLPNNNNYNVVGLWM
jgi:hypothetical protein